MTKLEGFKEFLAYYVILCKFCEDRARQRGTKLTAPLVGSLWVHVNRFTDLRGWIRSQLFGDKITSRHPISPFRVPSIRVPRIHPLYFSCELPLIPDPHISHRPSCLIFNPRFFLPFHSRRCQPSFPLRPTQPPSRPSAPSQRMSSEKQTRATQVSLCDLQYAGRGLYRSTPPLGAPMGMAPVTHVLFTRSVQVIVFGVSLAPHRLSWD